MHNLTSTSPARYQIVVQGVAEAAEAAKYGMTIISVEFVDQTTITTLVAEVSDQSKLMELFRCLLDKGLPIVKAQLLSPR